MSGRLCDFCDVRVSMKSIQAIRAIDFVWHSYAAPGLIMVMQSPWLVCPVCLPKVAASEWPALADQILDANPRFGGGGERGEKRQWLLALWQEFDKNRLDRKET